MAANQFLKVHSDTNISVPCIIITSRRSRIPIQKSDVLVAFLLGGEKALAASTCAGFAVTKEYRNVRLFKRRKANTSRQLPLRICKLFCGSLNSTSEIKTSTPFFHRQDPCIGKELI